MSHYFSQHNDELKSNEKTIYVIIRETKFQFKTDNGVFSKSGLDFGSRLLVETILDEKAEKVLDLGCGYGPIGTILGSFWPEASIDMTDINERAVKLAKINVALNHLKNCNIYTGDGFESLTGPYDLIVTNPPIRAGKQVVYDFFEKSRSYLSETGSLVFVMNKKQGAKSAIAKCKTIFPLIEVLESKSGYMIIRCKNN